jgi:hypothetical protein
VVCKAALNSVSAINGQFAASPSSRSNLNRRTAARVEQAVRIVSEVSIIWAGV